MPIDSALKKKKLKTYRKKTIASMQKIMI